MVEPGWDTFKNQSLKSCRYIYLQRHMLHVKCICLHGWPICVVNVGKYTLHGWFENYMILLLISTVKFISEA